MRPWIGGLSAAAVAAVAAATGCGTDEPLGVDGGATSGCPATLPAGSCAGHQTGCVYGDTACGCWDDQWQCFGVGGGAAGASGSEPLCPVEAPSHWDPCTWSQRLTECDYVADACICWFAGGPAGSWRWYCDSGPGLGPECPAAPPADGEYCTVSAAWCDWGEILCGCWSSEWNCFGGGPRATDAGS